MWNSILDTFGRLDQVSCGKLRTTGIVHFFCLCLMFGLCTGKSVQAQGPEGDSSEGRNRSGDRGGRGNRGGGRRGGFDPAEMVSRLDQDKNGVVTEDEIERMPAFIRESWQQQGLDFKRGIPVDELQQNAQRGMEELRRQRDEGAGGRSRDFGRSDRPEFIPPQGQESNGNPSGGSLPSGGSASATGAGGRTTGQKSRSRISPLLSESYQPLDADLDGQIALYEWRKGKRGPLSLFAQLDVNGDGFLTSKELARAATAVASTTPNAASPTTAAGTPAATPGPVVAPLAPVSVSAEDALKATRAFELLDKDKNGTIAGAEWGESKRLKPLFEKGGFDLAKPMNKDEFTQGYVRVASGK